MRWLEVPKSRALAQIVFYTCICKPFAVYFVAIHFDRLKFLNKYLWYTERDTARMYRLPSMDIAIKQIYRMQTGLHYSRHTKVKGIAHLFFNFLYSPVTFFYWWYREKPWPVVLISDDSILFLSSTEHIIEDEFSIVHYNVQSIAN